MSNRNLVISSTAAFVILAALAVLAIVLLAVPSAAEYYGGADQPSTTDDETFSDESSDEAGPLLAVPDTRAPYSFGLTQINTVMIPNEDQDWNEVITIRITNSGDENDDIELLNQSAPTGWTVTILGQNPIDVASGQDKLISILLQVPVNSLMGSYTVRIQGTSVGSPSVTRILDIPVDVDLVPHVTAEGPSDALNPLDVKPDNGDGTPDYRQGLPNDKVVYVFSVINTGNGPASFICSANSPNNWPVDILDTSFIQNLGVNEIITRRVQVTIPSNAESGKSDVIKFSVTSELDDLVSDFAQVETVVFQQKLMSLGAPFLATNAYPRDLVDLVFNVTNEGNGHDSSIQVAITDAPAGWNIVIDDRYITAGIDRYDWVQGRLNIVIPADALSQTYYFTLSGYTAGRTTPDSSITFELFVYQEYDVGVIEQTKYFDIVTPATVSHTITVVNLGNGQDTFQFFGASSDIDDVIEFNVGTVTIPYNSSNSVQVTITMPKGALAKSYNFSLTASSIGSDLEKSAQTFIVINVSRVYSLAVTSDLDEIDINPFETVDNSRIGTLSVNVNNTGNIVDIIELSVVSLLMDDWKPTITPKSVKLEPGVSRDNIAFKVTAPLGVEPGDYVFVLMAESGMDDGQFSFNRTISLTVHIKSADITFSGPLGLNGKSTTLLDPEYVIFEGEVLNISATIINNGDLEFTDIVVRFMVNTSFLGDIQIDALAPGEQKTILFTWNISVVRIVDLYAYIDPDDSLSESNETNNRVLAIRLDIRKLDVPNKDPTQLWDFFSILFIVIGVLLVIFLIVFLVVKIIHHRSQRDEDDKGLVEDGKYEFKERAFKAEFSSDLEDFEDEQEEDTEPSDDPTVADSEVSSGFTVEEDKPQSTTFLEGTLPVVQSMTVDQTPIIVMQPEVDDSVVEGSGYSIGGPTPAPSSANTEPEFDKVMLNHTPLLPSSGPVDDTPELITADGSPSAPLPSTDSTQTAPKLGKPMTRPFTEPAGDANEPTGYSIGSEPVVKPTSEPGGYSIGPEPVSKLSTNPIAPKTTRAPSESGYSIGESPQPLTETGLSKVLVQPTAVSAPVMTKPPARITSSPMKPIDRSASSPMSQPSSQGPTSKPKMMRPLS